MNDEQVNKLLEELSETRKSFDVAVKSIKWNRINTYILYGLIVMVVFLGGLGFVNYMNYRTSACERANELKAVVTQGMQSNAFAIGAALAVVFDAPQEELDRYLTAYNEQRATEVIQLREC